LLGLLREHPMHAYEMNQPLSAVDALRLVWRLKQSHLYALAGEAGGRGVGRLLYGNPQRPTATACPAVHARWRGRLHAPVRHGRDFRLEFLAKLFFAAQVGGHAVRELLNQQRAACEQWATELRAKVASIDTDRPFERLIYQFRITQIVAILRWLETCEQTLA
jgi:PadR family transcriptional regulator AphA